MRQNWGYVRVLPLARRVIRTNPEKNHLKPYANIHIMIQLKIPGPPLHELHLGDKHPTNRNGKSNGETDQDKQAEDVQVVAHLVKELY